MKDKDGGTRALGRQFEPIGSKSMKVKRSQV